MTTSLKENFAIAQERRQPYINLTKQIYSIAELACEETLKEIKKAATKFLYFRSEKVNFNSEFAANIHKLTKAGIKEIVILCDKKQSQLTTKKLNEFLAENKIYINFKIAQLSQKELTKIQGDEIGKDNLLGFDHFGGFKFASGPVKVSLFENKNQLVFKNGAKINFLNNADSNKIILENHAEHRKSIATNHEFILPEPKYITGDNTTAVKPRIKEVSKTKKLHASLEITKNIDLKTEISKETEEENELDLDKDQEDNKFDQNEATNRAYTLNKLFFKEIDLIDYYSRPWIDLSDLINKIFSSSSKIKFISSKALDLVIKNDFLFTSGINADNLPVGLAIKNGILFATEQRLSSMQINEFTIKPTPLMSEVSDPLAYTWLIFASKATISLNDIYGSSIAPRITGEDTHPWTKSNSNIGIMLDIPNNYYYRHYKLSKTSTGISFPHEKTQVNNIKIDYFFGMELYNLTPADEKRLDEIKGNLTKRGLLDIFERIIKTSSIKDGGFLLEDKAAVFLEKLFQDILPSNEQNKKLDFFIKILANIKFLPNSALEDVFEGLDAFYNQFQEFLLKLEIKDSDSIENKAIDIAKNQFTTTNNFKIILERIINIFELIINNGGNLNEQLEYLADSEFSNIIRNPETYLKAREFGLNIIHPEDRLNSRFLYTQRDNKFLETDLIDYLRGDEDSNYVDSSISNNVVTSSIRHLSSIAPHKRASIDTYTKYFTVLPNMNFHKSGGCNVRNNNNPIESDFTTKQLLLKTRDYVLADSVAYKYNILYSNTEFKQYITAQPSLDAAIAACNDLFTRYITFAVISNSIYVIYDFGKKGSFKLSNRDLEPSFAESLIEELAKLPQAHNKLYSLNAEDAPKERIFEKINYLSLITSHPRFSLALAPFLWKMLTEKNDDDSDNNDDQYFNALKIKLENNTYNIYEKSKSVHGYYDGYETRFNKTEISLPKTFDKKVSEWQQQGEEKGSIYLFDSEVADKIFANSKVAAYSNALQQIKNEGNNNFEKTQEILDSKPKEQVKDTCYASIGLIQDDVNLVTNFTSIQATRNSKLLVLNILASSGRHFDNQYPDQEFNSYISLFNLLFSPLKVYDDVQIGERYYKVEEDFNHKQISIKRKWDKVSATQEIKEKEEQHLKLINIFINIYKENPEFNFAQVVALGLIANLNINMADEVTLNAKALLPYNGYFTQALRILLSTSISAELDLNELNSRAKSIARIINLLNQEVEKEGYKIHQLLTENGKYPENIVFYATCLSNEEEVNLAKVIDLITKISHLDASLKNQLLDIFAKAKLPFAHGEMIASNFPRITLESLDDHDLLKQIIQEASNDQVDYEHATRFTDVSINSMENAKVDLNEIKSKYNLQLPQAYTYAQLKASLIKDGKFIKEQFKTEENIDLDLIISMFETITKHEQSSKFQTKKIAKILYNPTKTLSNQYLEIEANKRNLDEILSKFSAQPQKDNVLDILSAVPQDSLVKLLPFLKSLSEEKLQGQNYNVLKLLKAAGIEIISEYFDAFKIATEKFLNGDINIGIDKFYQLIGKISIAGYRSFHVKQIIEKAIGNKDYTIITLLAKANGNTDHIEKIVNWVCNITPEEIIKLNDALGTNSKAWLQVSDVEKIQIIGEVALKLQNQISSMQYKMIIEHVAKNGLAEAKLMQSYLINYPIENLEIKTRIDMVMNNLDSLENLQSVFANNHLARFNYNKDRVINKINDIILKNIPDKLNSDQQASLWKNFSHIFDKSINYKDLNINQIHDKAILLKHNRMLAKEEEFTKTAELDLEFLSLSFELLYRQTGKFPRDTQILSQLNSLLRYESIIEEIATGQGKSIITALFASYLWFCGQTVDVVSSSQDLASRDLKEFASFYGTLGIKHSDKIITAASYKDEYKKSGINYSTAADMALFRANREFYSNTHDVSLNADVSLVCDEVDSVLTSEINYKLATSMINTNQAETRVLFGYIIEFTQSNIFRNNQLEREDDIKNLELYLHYQLLKYNSSYKYPLNAIQMNELKTSPDSLANKLYLLNRALTKADQNKIKLFDKLLDAVTIAKHLENAVDYVLLKEDLDNKDELLVATPIIKDQPSKGTSFGDGVQAFLHLLIEEQMPHLAGRFDISAPSSTIFNLSPKNFFDYYRLTGGRIIGLTGTAGNMEEIQEFHTINKMLSFAIPRFEEDLREIKQEEVENKEAQIERLLEIVQSTNSNKPIIIFSETTKAAEEIYSKLIGIREHIQIYAASFYDTDTIQNVVNNAGNYGYLTVTTPMLGRGTDFLTKYPDGYLAINLCTDITKITLWQIYGRVGRNGQKGEIISLFDKEIFAENIDQYMDFVSTTEKEQRMQSQPLTDILKFFNQINHDNPLNAIACNEFIKAAWNNLIESNIEAKSYRNLRENLLEIVKIEYPLGSKKLDAYLKKIDSGTPLIDEFTNLTRNNYYQANYVYQQAKPSKLLLTQNKFVEENNKYSDYWPAMNGMSISIEKIEMPLANGDSLYKVLYNEIYKVQAAKLATHVFTIEDLPFHVNSENYKLMKQKPWYDNYHKRELIIYPEDNKLYCQYNKMSPKEIKIAYHPKHGIPNDIHNNILVKLNSSNFDLDKEEKEAINQYLIKNSYVNQIIFSGEGSGGDLMVDEFKKSFNAYKERVNSIEVNKISPLIDNFMNIMNLDLDKLEHGKYQAIHIVTKFTSSASHVESMLTDGKFLFWINRGGDTTGSEPGIKVFKITKDIDFVKNALKWLQEEKRSQAETRGKIYTMLREDDDQNIPEHILIPMQSQTIGNCGWTQTKGILKAAGIVGRVGSLTELPDVESQEWQKVIKDADDVYKDFVNYDIIKRLEAILFTMDSEFQPIFLSYSEQAEINERRAVLENPITEELLEKIDHIFNQKADKFINTIYENQFVHVRDLIALEVALNSDVGEALVRLDGKNIAKAALAEYQSNKIHNFEQINIIFKAIEASRFDFAPMQDQLLQDLSIYLTTSNYNIAKLYDFNDMVTSAIKECLNECTTECVMTKIDHQIIEETQEICLDTHLNFIGTNNIYMV